MMKRQKRDRENRAHTRGYQAGISGRSKEQCPYQNDAIKSQWLGGWREAIEDKQQGACSSNKLDYTNLIKFLPNSELY